MPIAEADPWRMQYFADAVCPDDVSVPTEDGDAYMWYGRLTIITGGPARW